MPVLTGLDVVGIQSFVFGSTRLRDVVGASWLVDWATGWSIHGEAGSPAQGALNEAGLRTKQVLLAAGGNAVLRFESMNEAKGFAAYYSRLVFDKAPGVEVVIAHREYKNGEVAKALRALQVDLARTKLERRPHVPLLGISVTASCADTGLPAVCVDRRDSSGNRLLSRQAERTGNKSLRERSTAQWRALLPRDWPNLCDFDFPIELDDLGSSSGERSLVGVVHIDGNSIGSRIQEWLTTHAEEGTDDENVEVEYREWSAALRRLGKEAMQAVLRSIFGAIESRTQSDGQDSWWVANQRVGARQSENGGEQRELSFRLRDVRPEGSPSKWWLPIRPILLGGDDLTFLCDGRIALDLAATALRAMEENVAKSVPHLGADKERITACAGVAIVPHHAPFVRSYELAEALCQSAKKLARKLKKERKDVSCIDWHVGLPKPGLSVSDVREREYELSDGSEKLHLTCRPYALTPPDDRELSWQWLDEALLDGVEHGLRASKIWNARRNKVKELREVLRSGPKIESAVKQAIERWTVLEKDLRLPDGITAGGFQSNRTPLLDALELLDLHLPLGPVANAAQQNTKESP